VSGNVFQGCSHRDARQKSSPIFSDTTIGQHRSSIQYKMRRRRAFPMPEFALACPQNIEIWRQYSHSQHIEKPA
jgi:hypothetical protein